MTIGINCISIEPEYTGGINSFTIGLLDGFSKINTTHQFNIFVSNKNKGVFEKYLINKNFNIIEIDLPSPFFIYMEWKSIKLHSHWIYKIIKNIVYKKQAKWIDKQCDILYTPTTTLFTYNSSVPNVLSMHDIQHMHYPQFFSKLQLLIRNITYDLSAFHADYLQVSSNFIKSDFLSNFHFLKPERLELIKEGVNIEQFRTSSIDIRKKYLLPDFFLFYPAQLWSHKNHITILKALLLLKKTEDKEISLVLTGSDYNASEQIFSFIKENNIQNIYYLGKVSFEEIIALYKAAKFLITASMHESSCLPILEAAAAGVPIIASDIPPNIEMGEIINLNLFKMNSYESLAETISKIWDNDKLINEQIKNNLYNILYYSWEKIAGQYLFFFEKIFSKQ